MRATAFVILLARAFAQPPQPNSNDQVLKALDDLEWRLKLGDIAEVNWITGQVRNVTKDTRLQGQAIPKPLRDIVEAGGVEVVLCKEGYLAAESAQDRR